MTSISLRNPESGASCEIELEQGLSYSIEAATPEVLEHLLEQLLLYPGTEVADSVGGMISSINALENIGLPAIYHGLAPARELERQALDVFAACGIDAPQAEALLRRRPADLSAFDKRLAGFVRGLLMAPGVLVYHRFLEGLTRREMERAAALAAVYRARHPTGTAVHLMLADMPVSPPACERRIEF